MMNLSADKKLFYQLSDHTQNVPEGDDGWIEQLKQEKTICDCWNIIKHKSIDVFLNETIKKSFAPISYVRGTFIGILREDIVLLLGLQNIENVYYAGKVYDINKDLSKEYISVVPKVSTFVRGGKDSNCRICDKCGAVLYFPLPLNSWYLVDKSIPNSILFPSALTGIIVNDEIYQKVKKSGIKRIGYEKLPVLQEAVDDYDNYFE
ncbi:hypothetical protein E4O00_10915 [Treponema sp. OMZ 788]|uniref:hypothetical protein n=1 Tax=Treponema sp. OMZ 788 TaxID=2563664 RepID=UPI0020A35B8B|nr:hypothetical protein [Treponema sp. OMZ 788]UTC64319.1 hypothetical protein E4O00_10915 [Treponema sp. OMZ 788]